MLIKCLSRFTHKKKKLNINSTSSVFLEQYTMVRINSIQNIVIPRSGPARVCKVMAKRTFDTTTICLVKLHYNGELYLCPEDQLAPASKEDRKNDKKNETYWQNQHELSQTSVSRIYIVDSPTPPLAW